MRSSLFALALVAAPGCDVVFGLDPEVGPCDSPSFDNAPETVVEPLAEVYSVSRDGDFGVFQTEGQLYQRALPGGDNEDVVDLSPYQSMQLGLSPEGDAIFLTAAIEPPKVFAGTHAGLAPSWQTVPVFDSAFAGTPSAAEFGPRHVIVRRLADDDTVQELVQDGDQWGVAGEPHELPDVTYAPNLTPSGLDMVFAVGSPPAIAVAHRDSTDVWFGEPATIFSGAATQPMLVGQCKQLFVVRPTDSEPPAQGVFRYDH